MSLPVRSLRSGVAAAAILVTMIVAVPSASGAVVSSSSGAFRATMSYSGTFPQSRNPRLTIRRSGKVIDSLAITSKWCGRECWPNTVSVGQPVLHFVHFRQRGPLDLVLDLYSGGAHCCAIEQVYSIDAATGKVSKAEHDFGDPGAKLEPLGKGGSDDFVSGDDRFAYAFTDYAASGLPIEILTFSHGEFQNVTQEFPQLIARDALQWHRAFDASASSHFQDTVGLAAAWSADEDMLGHASLVRHFLHVQSVAGHLNSSISPIEPSGHNFVVALQKFLRRYGYTT